MGNDFTVEQTRGTAPEGGNDLWCGTAMNMSGPSNPVGENVGCGYSLDASGPANVNDVKGGVNLDVGKWRDDGKSNYGLNAEAAVIQQTFDLDGAPGGFSGDWAVGKMGANASVGEDGANLGLSASGYEASATYDGQDPFDDDDHFVRVGGSAGPGGGARLHWGDADGDGHREYGLGADIGWFSFDYKTEDPAGDLLGLATLGVVPAIEGISELATPDYCGSMRSRGAEAMAAAGCDEENLGANMSTNQSSRMHQASGGVPVVVPSPFDHYAY